jgi:hypothetical protein
LADTLEKIINLEDYAVCEIMGAKINIKNRTKVLEQITELKNI